MSHFFAPDRLETPDFTLRCYQPGDGAMMQQSLQNSYEHLRTFMHWAKPYFSLEEEEWLACKFCGEYLTNQDFMIGIFSADGTRRLGNTGFHLWGQPLDQQMAEIGMWVNVESAGKGLATQVLRQMLHWGFTAWPWLRIEWRCDTHNLASAAVARKAGMQLEGTLRHAMVAPDGNHVDVHVFSMLRDEYIRSQSQ